jgi:hypothetical protein
MKLRWTIKQMKEDSDNVILRGIVAERMSDLNPYTPLRERLQKIYNQLDKKVQEERK